MSRWFDGIKAAENHAQANGNVRLATPALITACCDCDEDLQYFEGWNDYVRNSAYAAKLDQIERDYCHAVVNINYAAHTELEVLCILQKLQDERRQQILELKNDFQVNSNGQV